MKKSLALFLTLLFVFTAVLTFAFTSNVQADGCCEIAANQNCTAGKGKLFMGDCARDLFCVPPPICS